MNRLGKREKFVLIAGVAIVCLILIHAFIITPVLTNRRTKEKAVLTQRENLVKITELADQYEIARTSTDSASDRFAKREKKFELFSFLERLANQAKVKKNIKSMKPNKKPIADSPYVTSIVDMKLQGLTMEQLLGYLYKIETSKNSVSISRITITESGKDKKSVDAVLQVTTLETEKRS